MNKLKLILKSIGIYLLYICSASFLLELIKEFGINLYNANNTIKIIFVTISQILLIIITYFIYKKDLKKDFKDFKTNYKSYLKLGIKIWLLSLIGMVLSNKIIYAIYQSEATNETIIQEYIKQMPLYILFSSVVLAPFMEEIIFRKSIKDIFDDKYNIIYIVLSGLLFGYVHTTISSNPLELLYIIPYGVVGSGFAYTYTKTKNIYTTITIHAIHNLTVFLLSISLLK